MTPSTVPDSAIRAGVDRHPARALALVALGLTALLGVVLTALEADMAGAVVPTYESTAGFDVDTYARALDGDGPICEPNGSTRLAHVECGAYDDHGGLAYAVLMTAIAAAGAALRLGRGSRFGWLLLLGPLTDLVGAVAGAYAVRGGVLRDPDLPLTTLAAFVGSLAWIPLLVIIVPRVLMTVPTGSLPSPRWRWASRFTFGVAGVLAVIALLHPMLLSSIPNPIAAPVSVATADAWVGTAILGMLASWVIGAAGLLRRAGGAIMQRLSG